MKIFNIIIIALGLTMLSSCSEKGDNIADDSDKEITISSLSDDEWTYFSFESESVVGHSTLGDDIADAQWKQRNDWDIAFCGELVRTNGGTSGNGAGALQRIDTKSYDEATPADADNMTVDAISK
ncbi:MAG: HmuY family protein [Muribaculaceae bacterium]|nr:HmuY family protein [Muribaculaceae bacterium]